MNVCDYCGNGVEPNERDKYGSPCHMACLDERNRRLDAGECPLCGTQRAITYGAHLCFECRAMDNPPYVGYPGPGGA